MALGYYSYTVPPECAGQSVRTFLRKEQGYSAATMTALKYAEGITRNGLLLKAHDIIYTGDVIEIQLPVEKSDIEPVQGVLDILYEDDYLLVINKPPFMPVHPTKTHRLDTLANIASYYLAQIGESYVFRALNRLDKDTSGCVIVAKDRIAYSAVKSTVCKKYIALCEGIIPEGGTISAPIGLKDGSTMVRCVRCDGAEAITHYETVEYRNGHTLCELRLETGRTHQIRCHMSYIGHPLAGDDLYGGSVELIDRQALHCKEIEFTHHVSGKHIIIAAEMPGDFASVINLKAP